VMNNQIRLLTLLEQTVGVTMKKQCHLWQDDDLKVVDTGTPMWRTFVVALHMLILLKMF
jgi:hypothetical protein